MALKTCPCKQEGHHDGASQKKHLESPISFEVGYKKTGYIK